jgi:hypothetical protein
MNYYKKYLKYKTKYLNEKSKMYGGFNKISILDFLKNKIKIENNKLLLLQDKKYVNDLLFPVTIPELKAKGYFNYAWISPGHAANYLSKLENNIIITDGESQDLQEGFFIYFNNKGDLVDIKRIVKCEYISKDCEEDKYAMESIIKVEEKSIDINKLGGRFKSTKFGDFGWYHGDGTEKTMGWIIIKEGKYSKAKLNIAKFNSFNQ